MEKIKYRAKKIHKHKIKVAIATIPLAIFIITIMAFSLKGIRPSEIESILNEQAYANLSDATKNYIQEVYSLTGEKILTEENKKENVPYLNPKYVEYLNLSEEEKEKITLVPDAYILDYSVNQTYGEPELPGTFDLRNRNGYNFVSPLKDQGSTNICWAFASIENVETLYMMNNGQSYSDLVPKFSVRQMDYITSTNYLAVKGNWGSGMCSYSSGCSYTPWKNADNGSHELSKGGNFFASSIAMANGITLTDESTMPWHEKNVPVLVNDIYGYDKSLYEVNSTIHIPTINEDHASEELILSYVNDVKKYMIQYGGPFVGTYSPDSTCGFENTDGTKAMKTDDCVNDASSRDKGHAMQIIGWDDNYEYSYCDAGTKHYAARNGNCSSGELKQGKGAWIIKNSWGEETSYKYVYLTYDSTRLAIGFTTSISKMADRTWDNNYHSNPWIERNISNGMASVKHQTKEFNTHNTGSEKIEKIKFLTSSKNGTYNVSVSVEGKDYNNIETVTTREAGIYTIDLSGKNILLDNKIFSVKIEAQNEAQFINDSISVFTSNTSNAPSLETNIISGIKTYENPDGSPSEENVAFISSPSDTTVKMEHHLKNISDYKKISYNVLLNGVNWNKYFFDNYSSITSNMVYVDGVVTTTLDISKEDYSDVDVCGKVYTFQILYDNTVIESFPLKRICKNWDNTKTDYTTSIIRFHKNDGSGYYSVITKNDTTTFKIMKSDGTGNGYIGDESKFFQYDKYIKSWNTKPDGTGDSYTDNDLFVYKDMDLYAQWSNPETEPHRYEIRWGCQQYICHETNILSIGTLVTFNKEFTVPNNTFANLTGGQEFVYWALDPSDENKGIYYEEERAINISRNGFESPYNNDETEYLEAVWSDSYHSITFDANNGFGTMKSIKMIKDKTARLKYNLFERQGYTFAGWNTKADGTGAAYSDGQNISPIEDMTLYAQWDEVPPYVINNYNYNEKDNYISNIGIGTTVDQYKQNIVLSNGYTVEVDYKTVDGKQVLYTGGKTRIYHGSNLYREFTNSVKGDINGDGKISSADYIKIRKHIMETEIISELPFFYAAASANGDDKISSSDYIKIRKYIMNGEPL